MIFLGRDHSVLSEGGDFFLHFSTFFLLLMMHIKLSITSNNISNLPHLAGIEK